MCFNVFKMSFYLTSFPKRLCFVLFLENQWLFIQIYISLFLLHVFRFLFCSFIYTNSSYQLGIANISRKQKYWWFHHNSLAFRCLNRLLKLEHFAPSTYCLKDRMQVPRSGTCVQWLPKKNNRDCNLKSLAKKRTHGIHQANIVV